MILTMLKRVNLIISACFITRKPSQERESGGETGLKTCRWKWVENETNLVPTSESLPSGWIYGDGRIPYYCTALFIHSFAMF